MSVSLKNQRGSNHTVSLKPASPVTPTKSHRAEVSSTTQPDKWSDHPYALRHAESESTPVLRLYCIRHIVALTFALNTFSNAMLQMSFAAVQENSALKFSVSQSSVNIFSLMYTILFVPGCILCYYMFQKWGLRVSFLFASFSQTLGVWIRYLSVCDTFLNSKFGVKSYYIALVGTIFPALVQAFYTNSTSRIAAEWYSVHGRDAVTAMLSITNMIGAGFGMFLPVLFIEPNSTRGFGSYLLCQALIISCGFVATLLFHKNKPPTPPSMSQFLKLDHKNGNKLKSNKVVNVAGAGDNIAIADMHAARDEDVVTTWQQAKQDLRRVCTNPNFFWLLLGYGGGLGLFIALMTLISQYSAAFHYSSSDAGFFGALMIAGGIVGSIFAGAAMEMTKRFKTIVRVCIVCALGAMVNLVLQMRKSNTVMVCISFALVGMGAIPIVPIATECIAETTYPVSEDVGTGIVLVAGNTAAIVFTLVWGSFLPTTGHYYQSWMNESTYLLLGTMSVVGIVLALFNGDYKRLLLEQSQSELKVTRSRSQSEPVRKRLL